MSLEKAYLDEFCKKLEEIGWKELKPQSLDNHLIKEIFEKKVEELNKDVLDAYAEQKDKIMNQVYLTIQNADEVKMLDILRFGADIVIKKWNSLIPLNIKLIDYENVRRNKFNYIREQEIKHGNNVDRPDILLFVNGIPLVLIEGKSPIMQSFGEPYYEGLKQIMRYQKEIRSLFKFVQFGVVAADRNPYIPTFPREEIKSPAGYGFWKVNRKESIFDLLKPDRLLDVIRHFIFFTRDKKGERTKIIARYMQYFATKRAMERISKYLENKDNKNQGLIWHWQGSGKTYTMFFIAYQFLLRYNKRNPLVFFVIDRIELEKQLEDVFKSIEHKRVGDVKRIEKIEELKEVIKNADREWGLKITTIQKFQPRELDIKEKVEKKEVLFLIDEAHRSQYGDLAATMRKIFSKAIFIGFTGTPVFVNERNTFKHFAYPPDEIYLDVYFIQQSQEDGFTLPIIFRVIEEKKEKIGGIDILLSEDDIRAILEAYKEDEMEVDSILEGEIARKLKKQLRSKIRKTRIILENEKRIEKVVEYIKENIREDTENFTFKAMIVAANRTACVRYKKIMDKHFPEEFSEVVMSYQQNEKEEIHTFKEKFLKRYNTRDWNEANEKVRENFLKKEYPKVLIVTDMLLTGFDAPILKVMYLDKPIFYHRLLQATARVNRPYPELNKKHGLIVDSVGLLAHIQRTLNIYQYLAEENSEKIREDLKNAFKDSEKELEILKQKIDYLKTKLKDYGIDLEMIAKCLKNNDLSFYEDLKEKISGPNGMAMYFTEKEDVRKMMRFVKEALEIYKSLGAYPKKLDYKWEKDALFVIYNMFLKTVNKGRKKVVGEVWDKLIEQIHRSTVVEELIDKVEKEVKAVKPIKPQIKEAAVTFYEIRNVVMDRLHNPLYREIYERLERLRKMWLERNIGVEEFIKELEKEREEVEKLEKLEQKPGWEKIYKMTSEYLQKNLGERLEIPELKNKLKDIFERNRFLEVDEKEIRLIVAKALLRHKMDPKKRYELETKIVEMIIDEVRRSL